MDRRQMTIASCRLSWPLHAALSRRSPGAFVRVLARRESGSPSRILNRGKGVRIVPMSRTRTWLFSEASADLSIFSGARAPDWLHPAVQNLFLVNRASRKLDTGSQKLEGKHNTSDLQSPIPNLESLISRLFPVQALFSPSIQFSPGNYLATTSFSATATWSA